MREGDCCLHDDVLPAFPAAAARNRAQKLGDGSFGSVFTVYDDEGVVRALKVFDDNEDDGTMDSGTMREISMLRLLRGDNGHPGILKMHDIMTVEEGNIAMVMPKLSCEFTLVSCPPFAWITPYICFLS